MRALGPIAAAVVFWCAPAFAQPGPPPPPAASLEEIPQTPFERSLPRLRSAVDPVTSAPALGAVPELSAPLLDTLAGTLAASQTGAVVKCVVAPFFFLPHSVPVLSETRVELHGASSELQPWGFVVSTGYSSSTDKLQLALSSGERDAIDKACASAFDRTLNTAADDLNSQFPPALRVAQGAPEYAARVYTTWARLSNPAEKTRLEPMALALKDASYAGDDKRGDCWRKAAMAALMKRAYGHGFAIRLSGGGDFFPFVSGPKVAPDAMSPAADPVPNPLAGWNLGASVGYFPAPWFRIWLTGAFSRKRAKATVVDLSSRAGAGIDLAGNVAVGKVDSDGFQPGAALGGFAQLQKCLESTGCDEALSVYKDPLKMSRILELGGYVDIRYSAKVQLRIGVPFTSYSLAKPTGSDSKTTAWGIAPTISLTVASWMLGSTTSY